MDQFSIENPLYNFLGRFLGRFLGCFLGCFLGRSSEAVCGVVWRLGWRLGMAAGGWLGWLAGRQLGWLSWRLVLVGLVARLAGLLSLAAWFGCFGGLAWLPWRLGWLGWQIGIAGLARDILQTVRGNTSGTIRATPSKLSWPLPSNASDGKSISCFLFLLSIE